MNRHLHTAFVILFLVIIAIVPVVQTSYEYRTNPGHRIQLLDLAEDLFVTPARKAASDAALLDSLHTAAGALDTAGDRAGICAEAATTVGLLKKSVVDCNRHLQAEKNRWAARDTVGSWYRSLVRIGGDLDSVAAAADERMAAAVRRLKADVSGARSIAVKNRGFFAYVKNTAIAFGRILVGADYLRPFEKEMEKSSLFAGAVRPWFLAANYTLFRDLGSKGIQGTRNWLFYRPDVDYLVKPYVLDKESRTVDANDAAIGDNCIDTIVTFRDRLKKRGIDLLFVIMPTKASIYPEVLNPAALQERFSGVTNSSRMLADLRSAGVDVVDLFGPMNAERQNDAASGDSIYLRTDTHFKTRGVLRTAAVVAGRVKQYPWFRTGDTEYRVDTVTASRNGDIAAMIGLPQRFMRRYPAVFGPETTKCYQVRVAAGGGQLYKDDLTRSSILVLGDSFSRMFQTDQPKAAGWIAHLAKELGQPVASLVNDGGASTLVRETLARKPGLLKNKRLVIWEVVERDFRFGEKGWKDVQVR